MSVNSIFKAIKIIGWREAFYRQRIPGSSCVRKETVDIDIPVASRNGDTKIMQSMRITSTPASLENNEVEPVLSVQMSIYQSKAIEKT